MLIENNQHSLPNKSEPSITQEQIASINVGSAKKVGKRIKELERIYGSREGRPEKLPNNSVVTQENIASQMEISVDTLQNYKLLAEMIPELDELVETSIGVKLFVSKIRKKFAIKGASRNKGPINALPLSVEGWQPPL